MTKVTTGTVRAPGAVLTYDVRAPETMSELRPLFIHGSRWRVLAGPRRGG